MEIVIALGLGILGVLGVLAATILGEVILAWREARVVAETRLH